MENNMNQNVAVEAVEESKPGFFKKAGNLVKSAATSKMGCFVGGVATGVAGTLGMQKVASMSADSRALKALQATEAPARGTRRADY